MPSKRLNWNRRLSRSLAPAKGPVARLVTLRDAAWMILEFPSFRQKRADWMHVSELLQTAARTGAESDISAATEALEHAVKQEGWQP